MSTTLANFELPLPRPSTCAVRQKLDRPIRVLLVEDDPEHRELIRQFLADVPHQQYELDWCSDCENGRSTILQGRHDAYLIDLRLGCDDGLELLRETAPRAQAPMILLTAYSDHHTDLEAMQAGSADFLDKNSLSSALLDRSLRYAIAQKRAEAKLHETEQQLRHKHKLEAVGALAGGVAHEFNNLLQAIRGFTMFAQEAITDEAVRHDLDQVLEASERATAITRQLLAFGRPQQAVRTLVHPNEMITELMAMLRPLLGEQIELETRLDEDVSPIYVDTSAVQQALMNLCLNARDAMPEGGKVLIRTSSVYLSSSYAELHVDASPGPYVSVSVTDSGTGMSPQLLERVFEPFFTTKEVGRGTGLGLAMVHTTVKQHAGAVHVYSEPGLGSTFKLYFPACDDTMVEHKACLPDDTRTTGCETVLVVEDEPMLRALHARVLKDAGYNVLVASDGEQAVQIVDRYDGTVHLAVLDIVMPKMMGHQLYRALRQLRPDVRVVFCTGYDPELSLGKAVDLAEATVISKPCDPLMLLRTVRGKLDET